MHTMTRPVYFTPEICQIGIQTENILCQSGNLSDFKENSLFDQFTQTAD